MFRVLFTFPSRYWYTIGLPGVFSLGGWSRRIHTGFHVPRATQDTTIFDAPCPYGTVTPIVQLSNCFRFVAQRTTWSYNPNIAKTTLVWASPISLAATTGITLVFSSSAYLDVSVQRVRLPSTRDDWPSTSRVAPFGHPRINTRVQFPAAFRSLSRPSSPLGAQASPIRPSFACRTCAHRTSALVILCILFYFVFLL